MTAVWFVAWALFGLLVALGVASLPSIGMFVLAAAVLVGIAVAFSSKGRGWSGVFVGVGMVSLWLAFLHRAGPGEHCRVVGNTTTCGEFLNPLPFLILGVLALLVGFGILIASRRRQNRCESG